VGVFRPSWLSGSIAALALGVLAGSAAFAEVDSNGYPPELNYVLNCSGCHMADGSGAVGIVPSFRGHVARYLAVPEGRDYLAQVPGSAQSLMSSRNLAEVLNWMVQTYDPEHLPAEFVPYQEQEVARLRREPNSAPSAVRTRVLAKLGPGPGAGAQALPASIGGSDAVSAIAQAAPAPAAFAICAACHSVSLTGEHSIGPNLRGVVGRRAGTAPNFSYSRALRESGIVWTKSELDAFLTNVAAKVPGTLMAFNGLPDANDRQAVVDYLATLQLP